MRRQSWVSGSVAVESGSVVVVAGPLGREWGLGVGFSVRSEVHRRCPPEIFVSV